MSELPDADKYRQVIENWLESMADWHNYLVSIGSTERRNVVHGATHRMHVELKRLSLPNNWKPMYEFSVESFKLPEAK